MDKLVEHLPQIITAAAQSYLGIMALLSIALSVLAYFFFAGASEKIKVGIFVLLFLGVVGFGAAMFRAAAPTAAAPQSPQTASSPPQPAPNPEESLSKEAKILLKEAAADRAGLVTLVYYGAGVELGANGKNLITEQSRRSVAMWESALKELLDLGLLAARGPKAEIFDVTKKGYEVADRLRI